MIAEIDSLLGRYWVVGLIANITLILLYLSTKEKS